eukprot:scaffold242800_cov14-Tisochrysis_lutea.AAC.1
MDTSMVGHFHISTPYISQFHYKKLEHVGHRNGIALCCKQISPKAWIQDRGVQTGHLGTHTLLRRDREQDAVKGEWKERGGGLRPSCNKKRSVAGSMWGWRQGRSISYMYAMHFSIFLPQS